MSVTAQTLHSALLKQRETTQSNSDSCTCYLSHICVAEWLEWRFIKLSHL